jgi:3-hydroxyisobutyrate dehydrogenase-like beta-hydroxyacid dehydrogenase
MGTRVAVLGLGAMGGRLAGRLSAAGFDVITWSRASTSALPRAASIEEAVRGAAFVVSMVRDDEASQVVWREAFGGMTRGSMAVECSTVSPARAVAWGAEAVERGVVPLEAPVVGSRPHADAGTLVVLAGGAPDALERARPVLAAFSSAMHAVGSVGDGARMKLLVNGLFATQVALLGELLAGAPRAGLEAKRVVEVLSTLPVLSPAAKAAADGMLAGRFEPQFPLALAAKDLRYAEAVFPSKVLTAVRGRFDDAVAAGLGEQNLTAIVQRS